MKLSLVAPHGWLLGIVALMAGCSEEATRGDIELSQAAIEGPGGIAATLNVTSRWSGGYCANVNVVNKGTSTVLNWSASLLLGDSVISSGWGAAITGVGGTKAVTPETYSANISVNDTKTIGFCATSATSFKPDVSAISATYASGGSGAGGASGASTVARGGSSASGGSSARSTSSSAGGTLARGGSSATGGTTSSSSPTGTPVALHGQLKVSGTKLVDKNNQPYQLKGLSSMWLNWENSGYAQNLEGVRWLRDNWKLSVIRAAMGVEPSGAYLSDPAKAKAQVNQLVQNAITLGIYVIIDWHDHNAQNHTAQAQAFFDEMAAKWGAYPNVLYETFNEPLQVSWSSVLKPYHQAVVSSIRAKDPDNVVILGTPQWSQLVDQAAADMLSGTNLMYTLHFYSCSHGQDLRNRAASALAKGLPIFLTEWGATNADGGLDGKVCLDEAQRWHDFLNQNSISWAAWKFDDCTPDSSCILRPGAPVTGGFDSWLYGHGAFVRDRMKQ